MEVLRIAQFFLNSLHGLLIKLIFAMIYTIKHLLSLLIKQLRNWLSLWGFIKRKKARGPYLSWKTKPESIYLSYRYYLPLRTFCLHRCVVYTSILLSTYSLTYPQLISALPEQSREKIRYTRKFFGPDKYADIRTSFIIAVMGPGCCEKTGGNIRGRK